MRSELGARILELETELVQVFVAGGIIIDNVVASDGTVHRQTMGGNGVYSAAGARLWLDSVGIVGSVPSNYPMDWLAALRASRIDTAGITRVDETVDASEWFFYRGNGSRVDRLYAAPNDYEAFGLKGSSVTPTEAAAFEEYLRNRISPGRTFAEFRQANPLRSNQIPDEYWSAAGVHLAPGPMRVQTSLAVDLCGGGRCISMDPGPPEPAMNLDAPVTAQDFSMVDAVLPSEKELAMMAPGASVEKGLAMLIEAGAAIAAVKRGAHGSVFRTRNDSTSHLVPPIAVTARDPTGAGDAYCGGFLAGLVATGDALNAALCGTVSASFAVEAFGPFHLLAANRDAVSRRFRQLAAQCGATDAEQRLAVIFQNSPTRS